MRTLSTKGEEEQSCRAMVNIGGYASAYHVLIITTS